MGPVPVLIERLAVLSPAVVGSKRTTTLHRVPGASAAVPQLPGSTENSPLSVPVTLNPVIGRGASPVLSRENAWGGAGPRSTRLSPKPTTPGVSLAAGLVPSPLSGTVGWLFRIPLVRKPTDATLAPVVSGSKAIVTGQVSFTFSVATVAQPSETIEKRPALVPVMTAAPVSDRIAEPLLRRDTVVVALGPAATGCDPKLTLDGSAVESGASPYPPRPRFTVAALLVTWMDADSGPSVEASK